MQLKARSHAIECLPKHNACNKHLRQAVRARLQDSTSSHDCGANQDSFLPSEAFANGKSYNSPEETADIVDGRYGGEDFGPGWAD